MNLPRKICLKKMVWGGRVSFKLTKSIKLSIGYYDNKYARRNTMDNLPEVWQIKRKTSCMESWELAIDKNRLTRLANGEPLAESV